MPTWIRSFALLVAAGLIIFGLVRGGSVSDARWLGLLGISWILLLIGLWVPLPNTISPDRRTIVRSGLVLGGTFVTLSLQLLRLQVVQGEAISQRVGTSPDGETLGNPRRVNQGIAVQRGEIFAADGTPLARTTAIASGWGRQYPAPSVNGIVGYYSPLQYGAAGIELAYDEELTGEQTANPVLDLRNQLLHRSQTGGDVFLTLNAELQQLASDGLSNQAGSAVLIEVATGRVIAMANSPSYDPDRLFAGNYDQTSDAAAYWQTLLDDPSKPLVPRSTLGLYTPGSIFKVVTTAAAIDAGLTSPETTYIDDGRLEISGRVITGDNRPDESIIEWSLRDSLAWSLNIVYAKVGLDLGANRLREYAERFGFGADLPFDLPVATGQLEGADGFLDGAVALADTAFGQGELLVTPLHMAVLTAGIANGGMLMKPRLLDRVVDAGGTVVREGSAIEWRRAISAETASMVRSMMASAVEFGYAAEALIPGLAMGGKTGTAEVTDADPHAWFIGYAGTWQDTTPRYAVAVVFENGGSGALGLGRELLRAAADLR